MKMFTHFNKMCYELNDKNLLNDLSMVESEVGKIG